MPETASPLVARQYNWDRDIDAQLVTRLPYAFAKKHSVVAALEDPERINVICAAIPPLPVITELRRLLGKAIELHPLEKMQFERLMRLAYDRSQGEATQMIDGMGDEVDLAMLAQEIPETTDLLEASNHAPIVRLINALLTQAIREAASDIHLEAFENRSVVRFRVDGMLRDIVEPQRELHSALVSRLKVMAKLDIAEKRLPQDGRISVRVGDRAIDVRVSTLPTQHGERVVLRLLDKQGVRLGIGSLGMNETMHEIFTRLIHTPHGIILVTGPTGSGKTTTLYAGLSQLNRRELNILTVEDPVEYDLDGVGQTQVNPKIQLTFASGLRSILRQDPDVVLVGEIRDLETAEIAVQASLTGHLVFSTLHTNTAVGAVTRLVDMGVEPFLIASSLTAVLSQRLVRRLCRHCVRQVEPDAGQRQQMGLSETSPVQISIADGCDRCDHKGYRGRTGVYELIEIDEKLRSMIHDRANEDEMLVHVRRSTPSIIQDGFEKVIAGVTSLEEVLRVTRDF